MFDIGMMSMTLFKRACMHSVTSLLLCVPAQPKVLPCMHFMFCLHPTTCGELLAFGRSFRFKEDTYDLEYEPLASQPK